MQKYVDSEGVIVDVGVNDSLLLNRPTGLKQIVWVRYFVWRIERFGERLRTVTEGEDR